MCHSSEYAHLEPSAELEAITQRLTELEAEAPDAHQTETYIRLEERSWELSEKETPA